MKSAGADDIARDLLYLFRRSGELNKRSEQEWGLTGQQLCTFRMVAENEPIKISELARMTRLHPTSIGGMLDRLEAKGLLVRNRSTTDRRVVMVSLTDHGRETISRCEDKSRDFLRTGISRLPGERRENLAVALGDIMEILGVRQCHNNSQ